MKRVKDNNFPSFQDHVHAYKLYKKCLISYNDYKDVYEHARYSKLTRISMYLETKLNRKPSNEEIYNFIDMYVD